MLEYSDHNLIIDNTTINNYNNEINIKETTTTTLAPTTTTLASRPTGDKLFSFLHNNSDPSQGPDNKFLMPCLRRLVEIVM